MIRYSERIRRFSATAPPSNRFDWSSWSKRKKARPSPLAGIPRQLYVKTWNSRTILLIRLSPSHSIIATRRHFKSLEQPREKAREKTRERPGTRVTCTREQPVNRSRSRYVSQFRSVLLFLLLSNRAFSAMPERLRIYSRRYITHLHEPHRRTSRAYRATFKQASHVALTLDILATILGISRYGYRYCALYVSSPGRRDTKTPQVGGAPGGGRRGRFRGGG